MHLIEFGAMWKIKITVRFILQNLFHCVAAYKRSPPMAAQKAYECVFRIFSATQTDGGPHSSFPGVELPDLCDAEQVLAHQHSRCRQHAGGTRQV